MDLFGDIVRIPDFWQREAFEHLKVGRDVVIDAPTGAGKTYVFEMLIEKGFSGRAVYTVPTRALANDKYNQWRSQGWRVGISTGDYCVDVDAPIVVATLETQKNSFFSGDCPDLLVIDEYQLISDSVRGFNYELAIALAPKTTQLLLMSGSVANTADIQKWFAKIGRDCRVVSDSVRAVPLEEIVSTAIPEGNTKGVYGTWARLVKRIIDADMAPVLIFAPHRAEAEDIARKLSAQLQCPDFLNLPKSISSAAGRELSNMIRKRIAYHHSGLSAHQRSAIVERYARDGQLNVVVATTGLGAGVNFSMRSVIVVSREYETVSGTKVLRADELLQMYGRAGRRGKDKTGYAISLPQKPRLSDAKQSVLHRVEGIDSASSIRIMAKAVDDGKNHIQALKNFYSKLFSFEEFDIGWNDINRVVALSKKSQMSKERTTKIEILNSKNMWERKKPRAMAMLNDVLFFDNKWVGFLTSAKAVSALKIGRVCKVENRYGLWLDIAFKKNGKLVFTKSARKIVSKVCSIEKSFRCYFASDNLTLKNLRRNFAKFIDVYFAGAKVSEIIDNDNNVCAKISLQNARAMAIVDSYGAKLYRPPEREIDASGENDFQNLSGLGNAIEGGSLASKWHKYGLVDGEFKPTTRGRIFSFFNGGEGYAIAAAIEDESYAISDLVFDIANLRAGGRFHLSQTKASVSSRLADVCRITFLSATLRNVLKAGVPITYGEGASEIVREVYNGAQFSKFEGDFISRGDIERAYLEWQSFLRHISFLPDIAECKRWQKLKSVCREMLR